ncbi:glycosyltransferase family 2 protein [Sphingomonas sp.]|uniref:glycosyltransferase family 2 protein n=1 Tax=Sphingomonas sp. TaxID=28214 RepID=UPI003D6D3227
MPHLSPAPAVSILMPTYNAPDLARAAIDSVLAQSFTDFELIVIDDASTDTTAAMLAGIDDPRLRILRPDRNEGPVAARNRGFAAARGRYIAALDHDDLCRPGRLAAQVAYLDAHPGTVLVASHVSVLQHGEERPHSGPRRTTPVLLDWLLLLRNPLVWSSVMVRADAARALDPFNRPERYGAEDFDFYHRIRAHGAIARIDADLLVYRDHPGGVSKRFADRTDAAAIAVLSEAYTPLFGDDAAARATAMIRHAARAAPVDDAATLALLGDTLDRLHAWFLSEHAPRWSDRRHIAWHTARLWWRFAAEARRAGVPLRKAAQSAPRCARLSRLGAPALARIWLGKMRRRT